MWGGEAGDCLRGSLNDYSEAPACYFLTINSIKMYKKTRPSKTLLKVNNTYKGETIEQKIRRIVHNNEPIQDGSPIIYTERSEGVKPEHNIRTDRFEIAVDAMDKVSKSYKAKRDNKPSLGEQAKEGMAKESGETPANTSDSPK